MPVSQISIDGLWRCLCPSFDRILLSQSFRQTTRLHKSTSTKAKTRKRIQARSFTSTTTQHDVADTSSATSLRLSKGAAGRNLNVLKFTPHENISHTSHTTHESSQPLFPGIAENRSAAQDDEKEQRVLRNLFGEDLPDGVGRAKSGYRLGDWGNVPKGTGSVRLQPGTGDGATATRKISANKSKQEKSKERKEVRDNEQKLVDLGPAKWGTMSFGRQAPSGQGQVQQELEEVTPSRESATNTSLPAADTRAEGSVTESSTLRDPNARIAAAYEKYLQKTTRRAVRSTNDVARMATEAERLRMWGEEEIPMLHDRLHAYRVEAGQYDQVVALVEYLLVKRGDQLAVIHYDSLIRANADAEKGSAESVRVLIEEMNDAGIRGDSSFYHAALQTLATHPDYALRAEIMQEMKERWFGLSPEGWHSLVIGLLRDRQLEMALDRLEEMHTDHVLVQPWLYDIMTYVLCEHGEHDEAFNIMMYRYEHARFGISLSHWQYLLDTFSNASHYAATKHIWDTRVQAAGNLIPSDGTCTAILNVAARNSDPALATQVIKVLSKRHTPLTIHHYEALLDSYTGASDMKTAFRVLCITEKAGLPTSAGSTRPLFSHLCHSAEKCGTAWSLLRGLREEGHAIPVSAINVILESLNALDKTEEAYRYYHKLHQLTTSGPNLETINTMLQGLRRTPSPTTSIPTSSDPSSPIPSSPSTTPKQKALTLARSLLNHNLKANALTYDHLVRICLLPSSFETAKEDYEDAFRYLEEMEQVGRHAKGEIWWMSAGTANRMVEVCVEMGDLERVRRVLGEMERRGVDVRAGVREMVARLEGDGD